MTFVINGTTGATQSASFDSASTFGFKNRIINGAMMIDQRNAGASVTPTDAQYTLDRWQAKLTAASKYTVAQSSTAPTGFIKSLLVTSSSAYSVGASDAFSVRQAIEGFNVADFGWGAAGASSVTLSFWVRSSLTGTFGGSIFNASASYSYPFSYTVSSANTWTQISVAIAGPTSGTWATDNSVGAYVVFGLGVGSTYSGAAGSWSANLYISATGATSVVGTSGATFYITGVQLEKSSTATSFDFRSYGTELALCQRYYESLSYASGTEGIVIGYVQNSVVARYAFPIVVKRTAPTIAYSGTLAVEFGTGSSANVTGISQQAYGGGSVASLYFTVASGLTSGQACCLYANGTTVYITFSSEL